MICLAKITKKSIDEAMLIQEIARKTKTRTRLIFSQSVSIGCMFSQGRI